MGNLPTNAIPRQKRKAIMQKWTAIENGDYSRMEGVAPEHQAYIASKLVPALKADFSGRD